MDDSFSCTLCPRRCGALRTPTSGKGYCGMPGQPVLARAALHYGEEPCISGPRGSGAIFFSGCTLRCIFCQNRPISREGLGLPVSPARLADIFRELEDAGAHNINLVSPTPYVRAILQALELYRPAVPIVYNTSGYERAETLRELEGAVDIYLPDLKYLDSELSGRLSGAPDYFEFASAAIDEMVRQTGTMVLGADGMALRGTMVRHLLLPGHTRSSFEVLDWLAGNHAEDVWVSLMFQYTPMEGGFPYPELNRRATARECNKVWEHLTALGLTNGYVQDRSSAGKGFIPAFDFTGVLPESLK